MPTTPTSSEPQVVVDEDGVVARFAEWQTRVKELPIAALAPEGGPPSLFVADEVLVGPEDEALVPELIRMGAAVVPDPPLLSAPEGMPRRELDEPFPMPIRLRFEQPPGENRAAETLTTILRRAGDARGAVTASSEPAARMAALVARLASEGRRISLNGVGNCDALPLSAPLEWTNHPSGDDPLAWDAFGATCRIADAWHLVESVRAVRSLEPVVWIAVLDGGFWVDGNGTPQFPAAQGASDFGAGVPQVNLIAESAKAGGTNPNTCSGGAACAWHGNAVASAAAAAVGNGVGAAGAGGTVARPVFFRSSLTFSQIYRCLNYCTAWGLDVLNMSFSKSEAWELFSDLRSWESAFNFAVANGVVLVAGAGNGNDELVGQRLPDHNIRPATRTPGVITVGALDAAGNAAPSSNYGTSVNIWAPGSLPVAPNPDNEDGYLESGTSIAAPLVAGVAAMMRAVNPTLDSLAVRRILMDTAVRGGPGDRVTHRLDAAAAVLAALGGSLPQDASEPNNTAASAAALQPGGPGGSLQPLFGGISTRSPGDPDYYKFDVTAFSDVTITLEWYERLASLTMRVETDDEDNRGVAMMTRSLASAAGTRTLTLKGPLAVGSYRIVVGGTAHTAYRINVARKPATMPPDIFERNDSFERATRLVFEPRKSGPVGPYRVGFGPGTFDATLHEVRSRIVRRINPDYFVFDVPASSVFRIPTVTIADTDVPLDVTLYDGSRRQIGSWTGVRRVDVVPPPESTCWLMVSGNSVTRYTISPKLKVDAEAIPGPLEEAVQIPKWWGDPPPYRMVERVKHFVLEASTDRGDGRSIAFARTAEPVRVELLDARGEVMREATETARGMEIDLTGVERGPAFVRVSRAGAGAGPVALRVLPPRMW